LSLREEHKTKYNRNFNNINGNIMKKNLMLFLFGVFLFTGCLELPEDVTTPSWNTELNLPLTHKHYTFSELMKKTKRYIEVDSLNGFIYRGHYSKLSDKEDSEEFIRGKLDQSGEDVEISVTEGEGSIGIPFANGMTLDSAIFISGSITIRIYNNFSSEIRVLMTLPAFINGSGENLTFESTIAAGASEVATKELNGYYYYAYLQDVGADSLQIDGSLAGSNLSGTIKINYDIENTMFSYMAGIIPPTKIDEVTNSMELPITDDVKNFRDKLSSIDAQLTLTGNYYDNLKPSDPNEPFDLRIDTLYIKGIKLDNSDEIYLKLNGRADNNLGPSDIENGELREIYTDDNSNLSEFISFVPDSIVVCAMPTVNPNSERGAATNRDSLQFGFDLVINSILSFDKLSLTDTTEVKMDDDAQESIKDFLEAIIYFKIDNKVAFGGDIIMHFTDSLYNVLFTLDTLSFEGAYIDNDGMPSARLTEEMVELDSIQIQQLSNSEYTIMDIIISSTEALQGRKAAFTSTDWLDIISYCRVKYHLNLSD
jgi:hypothetical protein